MMTTRVKIGQHPDNGMPTFLPESDDAGGFMVCELLQEYPTREALSVLTENFEDTKRNRSLESDWCFSSGNGLNLYSEGHYIFCDHEYSPAKVLFKAEEFVRIVDFALHALREGLNVVQANSLAIEILEEGNAAEATFRQKTGYLGPTEGSF